MKQGTLSVAEYEGKFTKLSKYAPELVTNERKRIRRFVQRLNVEIQEGLAVAQISAFTEALEKAQRVERARMQVRDFHTKKRHFSSHTSGQASKSTPPSKMGRGMGGVRTAGVSRGALSRGGRSGPVQARGVPSSGPTVHLKLVVATVANQIIWKMIVGERRESVCSVVVPSTNSRVVQVS